MLYIKKSKNDKIGRHCLELKLKWRIYIHISTYIWICVTVFILYKYSLFIHFNAIERCIIPCFGKHLIEINTYKKSKNMNMKWYEYESNSETLLK